MMLFIFLFIIIVLIIKNELEIKTLIEKQSKVINDILEIINKK